MHLAACVLQQIDPLFLAGAEPEQHTDGGDGSRGTAYSEASRQGARGGGGGGSPAAALARAPPLPTFSKPRCVSGRLPGGLWYVRATLPPAGESSNRPGRKGNSGGDSGDGGENDGDGGGEGNDDGARRGGAEESSGGGGGHGEAGNPAKSFTTGAIVVHGGGGGGGGEDEEKEGRESGVSGDYFLVRVDSLDRVCDIIYCGCGAVEAKNLSKIVGVQLGYLQARGSGRWGARVQYVGRSRTLFFLPPIQLENAAREAELAVHPRRRFVLPSSFAPAPPNRSPLVRTQSQ